MYQQYQVIELTRDLNPVLKQGMQGVILEIWDEETYEVEFLDAHGFNYKYDGEATFTISAEDIKAVDGLP